MKTILLGAFGGLVIHAHAAIGLPRFFSDHMVLQREKPVAIWGSADPGVTVKVSFQGKSATAKANAKGAWKTVFGPFPASSQGAVLTISVGSGTKTLQDVLVGEVWFASGQSNMQFALAGCAGAKETIAAAGQPAIRFFMTGLATAAEPESDVGGTWQVSSPQTAPRFSGVGYHFARKLHAELGVPVGVIQAAWGGKPIQTFMSRESLASLPEGRKDLAAQKQDAEHFDEKQNRERNARVMKRWEQQMADWKARPAASRGKPPRRPQPLENPNTMPGRPTTIFNAMVAPFAGYAMRGAIWYQGEANAKSPETATAYGKLLPTMIGDWRKRWGDEFRFLWVQLANYRKPVGEPGTNEPWAILQDQQRRSLTTPKSGMAVINDIGDAVNIHPTNKKDVGERLARWALADDYGKAVVKCGPLYQSHSIRGGKVTLRFEHIGEGLKSADGGPLKGFEIRGAGGAWHWADAMIEGGAVTVSSPEVARPAAARYAWASNPTGANLVNSEGLPASVFTTE